MEGWDDRGYLLDDLLIEADRNAEELETPSFWDGWREDVIEDEDFGWEEAA